MDHTNKVKFSIDSKLINISVYNNKNILKHAHNEIELIYVINGSLHLTVNDQTYTLTNSDFVIINSNEFHSISSEEENLYVVIHLDYYQALSLLSRSELVFECNSVIETNTSDSTLRTIIEQFLAIYMKDRSFHVELLEKACKLISFISIHYLKYIYQVRKNTNTLEGKQTDRLSEILSYIQQNFRENLTLEEVASTQYISVPYLSKFFKKQTGKTFSQYINEIRLGFAVNDLINSNKTITHIALDNGFPNLVAFNRVFRERYQVKPFDYRKKNAVLEKDNLVIEAKNDLQDIKVLSELKQYLRISKDENLPSEKAQKYPEFLVTNQDSTESFLKNWNKLINVGYTKDLLNSDMQEQLKLLQRELGFLYARLWGLLSDDMLVDDQVGQTVSYNFSNTNKILDFLVANNLKPFIELGPKPKMISKKIDQTLVIEPVKEKPLEDTKKLISAFLLQCVERYGIEEVETWYFEVWKKHLNPNELEFNHIKNNKNPNQFLDYLQLFSEVKKIVNDIVPSAKVGGCGLTMDLEGDKLELLLNEWKLQETQPDFLSVYLYPIEINNSEKIPIKNLHSANPDFVKKKLCEVRRLMEVTGYGELELNVTEWNISISNRNFLNDSCFKAAYIVKNIIQNIGDKQVNMIGYWLYSDIFSNFRDTKNLLHGGVGLVTKNGIKKPSYHVYTLLKQLGDECISLNENFIVTRKSGGRYQVLCFNYKHFNYSYYLHPEGSVGINEQYDIFEDKDTLSFAIKLDGIRNGKYRIKEQKLNRYHGSVLDEWLNFGTVDDMKLDEVEYLKQICVPHMKVDHAKVEENHIIIDVDLEPHEVRLIELNILLGK